MAPRVARAADAYQASPESRNPLVPVPPSPPSPLGPHGGRGPGRGAQGPFANQKNRRAQNDLGRRPSTPQKRGAVDQGHSAATERTQALDDEPRRPARTRCSAARRSFKGQFDSQHRRRYRPAGSTPLRVRTVFFKAVMFPLHCYTPTSSSYPACRFPLSPQLIRSCSRYTSTNARLLICEFY